mmetsp:Transcript_6851/g.16821  ORF Transcript_6851/g.16821 Transcript_6851/m.16821 type:complete len:80 (+) Transcript_6851:115-354(+)
MMTTAMAMAMATARMGGGKKGEEGRDKTIGGGDGDWGGGREGGGRREAEGEKYKIERASQATRDRLLKRVGGDDEEEEE